MSDEQPETEEAPVPLRPSRALFNGIGIGLAIVVVLAAATVVIMQVRQGDLERTAMNNAEANVRLTRSMCTTEEHTRQLFAFVLTTVATGNGEDPDTPEEDARERRLADQIEGELRRLPPECRPYVDPESIRIEVTRPQAAWLAGQHHR
jgi:hypothetical protein